MKRTALVLLASLALASFAPTASAAASVRCDVGEENGCEVCGVADPCPPCDEDPDCGCGEAPCPPCPPHDPACHCGSSASCRCRMGATCVVEFEVQVRTSVAGNPVAACAGVRVDQGKVPPVEAWAGPTTCGAL